MISWLPSSLLYVTPLVSFSLTWIVLTIVIRKWADRVLDHPNERSLHQRPVSRMGGIGVAAGIAASAPFVSPVEWWPFWLAACFLAGVSFFEDIIGLPIIGRLLVHFGAAGGAAAGLLLNRTVVGWALLATAAGNDPRPAASFPTTKNPQRISANMLPVFRTCGLASDRTSFALSRTAMSGRLLEKLIEPAWHSTDTTIRDFSYCLRYSFTDAAPDLIAAYRASRA